MKSSGLILFICAGLLLSGGAILGGLATSSLVRMSYYFWTTDLGVELASTVIFLGGVLLCLPTCWLATVVPVNTKSTPLVACLMVLSMASMLMLSLGVSSITSLSRAIRDPAALNASMLRAMSHVGFDPAVRSSFSAMQIELKCCGVHSTTDWLEYRHTLPLACCGRLWNGKWSDHCGSPTFTKGCLGPALAELRNFVNSITVLASAIIIVMAVTLFTSSYALVSELLESAERRFKPQQFRIACLQPQATLLPNPTSPPLSTTIHNV